MLLFFQPRYDRDFVFSKGVNMIGTAVLIHGCHLQAELNGKRWLEIVLGAGEPDQLCGRVPMGLQVAFEYDADCIMFGTGASSFHGVSEARCTYNAALGYQKTLSPQYQRRLEDLLCSAELFEGVKNTRQEVQEALSLCAERQYARLILVSSPWHIPRCHLEALTEAEQCRLQDLHVPEIIAIGSHGPTEEVAISEPPHRGDRPIYPIHTLIRRADSLGRNTKTFSGFTGELRQLLEKWEVIKNSS
ncbi:MAG: YdcF family protein [Candidatus Pacebacteria bacterium]|nr:YdcF family protein [Candidatus Paceibacterota bacterium]